MTDEIKPSANRIRSRTKRLRQQISRMDFVASGTLHVRTKTCGKKNCQCATDPAKRHGPYYEWARWKDGKLLHKTLSRDQARLIQKAIANHRTIEKLLADWEQETASEVLNPSEDNDPI
jgi:hypothetical protein